MTSFADVTDDGCRKYCAAIITTSHIDMLVCTYSTCILLGVATHDYLSDCCPPTAKPTLTFDITKSIFSSQASLVFYCDCGLCAQTFKCNANNSTK